MTDGATQTPPALADRLGSVRVGLRGDLQVSRHIFRQSPCYIVRDPVTFQSQRLEPSDYAILVNIESTRPLAEILDDLIQQGQLETGDDERFYEFIMALHRLGFLHLPVADHKLLYRRHQIKEQAKRKAKLMGFLFLRIPLWNPDAFLNRTIRFANPVFSPLALTVWLIVVGAAGYVVMRNWGEIAQPLQGLMATRNLPLMWITLIMLKVFHEFGHAYACKHYDGHVPEMGAYLIMFTPCAYVDATASWGFARTRDRIVVCLAGMYIESFIAAVAVFVWAMTSNSLLHSLAYNVMFLASLVTVLFNVNPLMRYDGYYVLSDLVEVPNLRARSTAYVMSILKRIALGVRTADNTAGLRLKMILLGYGVCATMYRIALLLTISAMLASKVFLLGMAMAVGYMGSTIVSTLRRLVRYLCFATETSSVRGRAIAIGVLALLIAPAVAILVPLPAHVHARGLLTRETVKVVRARTEGFLTASAVECGQLVDQGDLLVTLGNDVALERIAVAQANLHGAEIRSDAYRIEEPDRAMQEDARAKAHTSALREARGALADLTLHAPIAGTVVTCLDRDDVGSFIAPGMPIAMLASGRWRVQSILTEEQLTLADPKLGDHVEFRAAAAPAQVLVGTVVQLSPGGSRMVEHVQLTHIAGGDIAVNPQTGEAAAPYFELTVELSDASTAHLRHGMTGTLRLPALAEPIATRVARRFTRFVNNLMRE